MGSHHLEYGFLSTHSTNSVSIALYFYSYIHASYFKSDGMSGFAYFSSCAFIIFYIFSIVFGRLYCGMHSMTDCMAGILIGAFVWAVHAFWWSPVEEWLIASQRLHIFGISSPDWIGTVLIAVVCGVMVHRHPQPIDDCPCFEDAIAFVSVVGGMLLGFWGATRTGFEDSNLTSHMPGSPFPFSHGVPTSENPWTAMFLWWGTAITKLVVGISAIFIWRIFAKFIAHLALPPLFRLISNRILPRLVSIHVLPKGSGLPNRRFYTPATEYDGSVPLSSAGDGSLGGLRSIPSVIDLPASVHEGEYFAEPNVKRWNGSDEKNDGFKRRKGGKRSGAKHGAGSTSLDAPKGTFGSKSEKADARPKALEDATEGGEVVKHYDADGT